MATYREMQQLAENPERVRALASHLQNLSEYQWTDWEVDFLENMAAHAGPDPITMRQREVLAELEEDTKRYSTLDGLSISSLIRDCWIARIDLSEDDEEFIDNLKNSDAQTIRRGGARRLLRCAKELGIIERYIALD